MLMAKDVGWEGESALGLLSVIVYLDVN